MLNQKLSICEKLIPDVKEAIFLQNSEFFIPVKSYVTA